MRAIWQSFLDFFVSLRLTVVLLLLSIMLVFFATLNQTELGIWGIQQKWFHSWVVLHQVGDRLALPIFPGGYFLGWLLFFNLLAAHIVRFKFSRKKAGIWMTHVGLILLLLGEFFSSVWQEEFQLRFRENETKNYAEHIRRDELVLIDTTDPQWDEVIAIPEEHLSDGKTIAHPKLPFRVNVRAFYPNAVVRNADQVRQKPPVPAGAPLQSSRIAVPLPITYKMDERNMRTAYVELVPVAGGTSLGMWLVSSDLEEAQSFTHEGKTWKIAIRPQRQYQPFSLTLLQVTHDVYPGSTIPKNFSSRVRVRSDDGRDDREVLIYMNHPLRYGGLAFYQFQMTAAEKHSVLQVMRNPSWLMPYIACILMSLGLVFQFGLSLLNFVGRRNKSTAAVPSATGPARASS